MVDTMEGIIIDPITDLIMAMVVDSVLAFQDLESPLAIIMDMAADIMAESDHDYFVGGNNMVQ
jgi:hypothetical protein